jgi:hypothetical protein
VETATPPLSAVVFREEHPPQLEMPVSSSGFFTMAAAEEKGKLSKEGIFVITWLWKHLGLSGRVLDWVVDGLGAGLLDGLLEKPNGFVGLDNLSDPGVDGSDFGQVSGLVSGSSSWPDPEPSEVLCSVWGPVSSRPGSVADSGVGDGLMLADGDGVGSAAGDGFAAGIGSPSSAVVLFAAGDGFVSAAGDGIVSADGDVVGSVVGVGFAAGGGSPGSAVADFCCR